MSISKQKKGKMKKQKRLAQSIKTLAEKNNSKLKCLGKEISREYH